MKQQAVSIRIGWVIEYKGKPWTVVKATHIKPGKGGAFMQVEMKSVEEGTKTNERFRSEDTVEKLMVEEKDCQFLYEDCTSAGQARYERRGGQKTSTAPDRKLTLR